MIKTPSSIPACKRETNTYRPPLRERLKDINPKGSGMTSLMAAPGSCGPKPAVLGSCRTLDDAETAHSSAHAYSDQWFGYGCDHAPFGGQLVGLGR